MTYLPAPAQGFLPYATTSDAIYTPASRAAAKRPSLWRRFAASVMASRRRQADLEIARYVALNGGQLTDGVERQIARLYRP